MMRLEEVHGAGLTRLSGLSRRNVGYFMLLLSSVNRQNSLGVCVCLFCACCCVSVHDREL